MRPEERQTSKCEDLIWDWFSYAQRADRARAAAEARAERLREALEKIAAEDLLPPAGLILSVWAADALRADDEARGA